MAVFLDLDFTVLVRWVPRAHGGGFEGHAFRVDLRLLLRTDRVDVAARGTCHDALMRLHDTSLLFVLGGLSVDLGQSRVKRLSQMSVLALVELGKASRVRGLSRSALGDGVLSGATPTATRGILQIKRGWSAGRVSPMER